MKIRKEIADACTEKGFEIIAQDMGYPSLKKGVARLDRVLKSPNLGLIKPEYDGLYSSEAFVSKLLNVLGLDRLMKTHEMNGLRAHIDDERYGYRPWLFVDTNFKRTSQTIISLACLESRRRLSLPKELKRMPLQELLAYLKSFIADFLASLKERDGEVELWGKPVGFYCHLSETYGLKLGLSGELIEDIHEPVHHGGHPFLYENGVVCSNGPPVESGLC